MAREKAASRVDITAPAPGLYATVKAAVYYEINHLPKRGITSREIVKKYNLGESWYSYEGQGRRVNLAGQLVRNELNDAYKRHEVVKLWSPRTGLVKRDGFVVFTKPGVFLDKQVEYGVDLPDARWMR